jgi:hypothetical protein
MQMPVFVTSPNELIYMSYVDDAFDKLKSNLEITQTEQDLASTRHTLVREHVRASWKLVDDFLTGSYARRTKTKKLKDVDIFVVIDPKGPQGHLANGTGMGAVQALRDLLASRWDGLRTDEHVVIINYPSEEVASYEVAPAFPRKGGGYLIPNGAGWMATDPTKHADLVTAKNKKCDDKFVPFVKMVKGINREANDALKPSFLLEVMGLALVLEPFGRYRDEIRFFLASASDRVTEDWPDPAGLGPNVNGTLSIDERQALARTLRAWLALAEDALLLENEGKERAAVDKWRKIFGWRMPLP